MLHNGTNEINTISKRLIALQFTMNVAIVFITVFITDCKEGFVMPRVLCSFIICLLFAAAPAGLFGQASLPYSYPPVFININDRLIKHFKMMDSDLADASRQMSKTPLRGLDARRILRNLCSGRQYVVDCAAVNTKGIMVTIEPEGYQRYEGVDISRQQHVAKLLSKKEPVFSNVFRAEEGFDAVDLEHPVFNEKKEFIGSVSILIRPEMLLASVIEPLLRGIPTEVWVMQKDGRILYDAKKQEIGKMLFSDPLYKPFPGLLAIGERITKEPQGSGTYEFYEKESMKPVMKEAFWSTIGLYGVEWRLIVTRYPKKGK